MKLELYCQFLLLSISTVYAIISDYQGLEASDTAIFDSDCSSCASLNSAAASCSSDSCFCESVAANNDACYGCVNSYNTTLGRELNMVLEDCDDATSPSTPVREIQISLAIGGGFTCGGGRLTYNADITIGQGSILTLFTDETIQCGGQVLTASIGVAISVAKRAGSALVVTLANTDAAIPAGDFQTSFGVSNAQLTLTHDGITYAFGLSPGNDLVVYNPAQGLPPNVKSVSLSAEPASNPTTIDLASQTNTAAFETAAINPTTAMAGFTSNFVVAATPMTGFTSTTRPTSANFADENLSGTSASATFAPMATPSECVSTCSHVFLAVQSCFANDYDCLCSPDHAGYAVDISTCIDCVKESSYFDLSIYISNIQAICAPTRSQPIVVVVISNVIVSTQLVTKAETRGQLTRTVTSPSFVLSTTTLTTTLASAIGTTFAPVSTPVLAVVYSTVIAVGSTTTRSSTIRFARTATGSILGSTSTPVSNAALLYAYPDRVILPRLLVPIQASKSSSVFGSVSQATVDSVTDVLALFDIPAGNYRCLLEFDLPPPGLNPASQPIYSLKHGQAMEAYLLSAGFSNQTSFSTAPRVSKDLGQFALANNTLSILSKPLNCTPGTSIAIKLSSSNGTSVSWFEKKSPQTGLVLNQYK